MDASEIAKLPDNIRDLVRRFGPMARAPMLGRSRIEKTQTRGHAPFSADADEVGQIFCPTPPAGYLKADGSTPKLRAGTHLTHSFSGVPHQLYVTADFSIAPPFVWVPITSPSTPGPSI